MTAGPIFTPAIFTARDGAVLFEGREVPPSKAALIKHHLNLMGRATEDVPTLRMLDAVQMQLIAASVAAVNQRRESLRLIKRPAQSMPPSAA